MDALDQLPLDVLLALRDAVADPTEAGRQRAQERAAEAGFYLECLNPEDDKAEVESPPTKIAEPIPMEAAPDNVHSIKLAFDAS